jgi:hypothetical protein
MWLHGMPAMFYPPTPHKAAQSHAHVVLQLVHMPDYEHRCTVAPTEAER